MELQTQVCVAGGGPAGMVLGLLLARAGLEVTVLEKHSDFLRDFRGDTIHPVTLDLLTDLGLHERVAAVSHSEVRTLDAVINGVRFSAADFTRVGRSGELWFMPQWDLLNALAEAARAWPSFTLRLDTAATGLVHEGGRIAGVTANGPAGPVTIRADLTVAADGRDSILRAAAGLDFVETGVPIDVLWFRVDRPDVTPPDSIAYLGQDAVITIPRPDYYQCALLIDKHGAEAVRSDGLAAFRRRIAAAVPFLAPTIDSVADLDDVRLLDVRIAYAPRWHRPGFLLIGDAAHAMSPAFGVGINYAIQDAVATARLLSEVGPAELTEADLHRVQRRRELPVRAMQRIQLLIHHTLGRAHGRRRLPPAAVLRRIVKVSSRFVRHPMGRLVGAGFRPERLDFGATRVSRPAP